MSDIFERLDAKRGKEIRVLSEFIAIFCREHHRGQSKGVFPIKDSRLRDCLGKSDLPLCKDCSKLLNHGIAKRLMCPYDPKPKCRKCETHCYAPGYRERIREVMRFSGMYLVKRGRLDLLGHYLV